MHIKKCVIDVVRKTFRILLTAYLLFTLHPDISVKAAPISPGLSIQLVPSEVVPAQAGYIYIGGGYPLQVSVTLDNTPLDVYWSGSSYLALFSFGFDDNPGTRTVITQVFDPATYTTLKQTDTITLLDFQYQKEQVTVPYRLAPLLDPDLNQAEFDQLCVLYSERTRPSHWNWPFILPVPGGIVTSRFGGNRNYNWGMLTTHHTGIDIRRATGEPVYATADGHVIATQPFDIRGNVVIIDHGYGVFSQYAHLSEFRVKVGQDVRRNDVIGLGGATGRVSGPHLHFEIIVNGIPVDPIRWFALAPGFVPPGEFVPDQVPTG